MSDKEPGILPQEFIGLPKSKLGKPEKMLIGFRDKYRECLKPVLIEKEKVNPKILEFERQLNGLNEQRAKFYGRTYNPPEVFYVDAVQGHKKSKEINEAIRQKVGGLGKFNDKAGVFQSVGNFIIISLNNFDDPDVDNYNACRLLRHEMAHAGSVTKHRAYNIGENDVEYEEYRSGAAMYSKKRDRGIGRAVNEGYNSVEDEIFDGLHPELLERDVFLKKLPNAEQLFPGAREKYNTLRRVAIIIGDLKPDQMLMTYRVLNGADNILGTARLYTDYSNLMNLIYSRNPELFDLSRDFVYGDKMIAFAKAIEKTFGKGFYKRLMHVMNPKGAEKLAGELSSK